MRSLLSIAVLFLLSTFSIAQIAATPVNEWVKKLSDPKDKKNQASRLLWDSVINSRDSSRIHKLLQQLQANANSNSTYFQIRLNLFKALVLNYRDILRTAKSKTAVMKLMKQAMQEANETNDEYLMPIPAQFTHIYAVLITNRICL